MIKVPNRRWSGLAVFSVVLHIVWLVVFLHIFYDGAFIFKSVPCEGCESGVDAIRLANDMGRLDFVALGLTVLGIVIALAAFGGFFLVRHAAITASHDETSQYMERHGPEWTSIHVGKYMSEQGANLIGDWLENNPAEIRRAMSLVRSVDDDTLDTDAIDPPPLNWSTRYDSFGRTDNEHQTT